MKKNSQLHLSIDTLLLESLKKKADARGISLAEYCRSKLREGDHFEEIKIILNSVLNKR